MQTTTMLPNFSDTTQTISFSEGDGVYTAEVFAKDVIVTTNAGSHNHGSSKIKVKSLVDYNWEPRFYLGQLLALHMNGKYLAYSIKATNTANPGTWSGMVRVVYNIDPDRDIRSLIKGMKGEVQDLSFAHIPNQVVLACIDDQGHFYIHEIELCEGGLRCKLLAEIYEDIGLGGNSHRVVWCPYIPADDDEDSDSNVAHMLLTTHANTGLVWNVRRVEDAVRGATGGAGVSMGAGAALATGAGQAAAEHGAFIVDGAFAPDGTALATAAADGYVMFFQVFNDNDSSPRCLHKWQPHEGKPVSCLFFLDNHNNHDADIQFWKHAVTGADYNTVLKIWSCKNWICLQTITFAQTYSPDAGFLGLKAMVDKSARYLVVSELKSRCLYVLQLRTDGEAYCTSISEFLVPYPVLSFVLREDDQILKRESSCGDPYDANGSSRDLGMSPNDYDLNRDGSPCSAEGAGEGGGGAGAVRLQLYLVQPKGLQEAALCYSPPPVLHHTHEVEELHLGVEEMALGAEAGQPAVAVASSILQQQSQQLKNLLMRPQTQPAGHIGQRVTSPAAAAVPPPLNPLNLMTPDAFSSPGKREEEDPPLSSTPEVANIQHASRTASNSGYIDEPDQPSLEQKFTSAGSSPSREVQEIMSLSDTEYYKEPPPTEEETTGTLEQTNNGDSEYPSPAKATPEKSENLAHGNDELPDTETSWPQISIAQINEANQRKASSDKSSSHSLNQSLSVGNAVEAPGAPAAPASLSAEDRARIDALDQKLDSLMEMMAAQSRAVMALRAAPDPREVLEQTLQAHAARTSAALDKTLADGWERVLAASRSAVQTAATTAAATAAQAAGQAAGRGAAQALEPLATALQGELAAKLSATDRLLHDNLDKLVTSKSVMERLSTAVSTTLSELVRVWFRDSLGATVLPALEKAHAQLFRQLSQVYQQGLKEMSANTEALSRAAAERGAATALAPLHVALERHTEALSAAAAPPAHHITAAVTDATKTALDKELSWWRTEARSVMADISRVHSPAPSSTPTTAKDRQMQVSQIQSMVASGELNGAFQLALSASDLALVMLACRVAEPARVFGPPCALRQHVLLSLVQQLAADMTHDTQLKHRYLEEAILNMDTNNPVTREHLPVVVRELKKQVGAFLAAHPAHALARQLRMLNMAADSLLGSL